MSDAITITVIAASDPEAEMEFEGPLLDFEGLRALDVRLK
jgi:hypothetical protein